MDYYISQGNGQKQGPFKRDKLLSNGLKSNTLVWREGMSQWMAANAIPELADLLNSTTNKGTYLDAELHQILGNMYQPILDVRRNAQRNRLQARLPIMMVF